MPTARDEFLAALVVATAAMTVVNEKFKAYEEEREQQEEDQRYEAREAADLAELLAEVLASSERELEEPNPYHGTMS